MLQSAQTETKELYVFLDRRYANLAILLMFSSAFACAVGRECTTCPTIENIRFIRLDNEDKYRADIHTFVSDKFLRTEVERDFHGIFSKMNQASAKMLLDVAWSKDIYDDCIAIFETDVCEKIRAMLKSALKLKGQSKLEMLADINITLLREIAKTSISYIVERHGLLCVRFSALGYMCFKPAEGDGGIINASDIVNSFDKLEELLKRVNVEYKISTPGDELYDKVFALNRLRQICRREKQMCDILLKYYIPEHEYVSAQVLHALCITFGEKIVCPTSIPNAILTLDLFRLLNIY